MLNYFLSSPILKVQFFLDICNFDNSAFRRPFLPQSDGTHLNSSLVIIIFWPFPLKEAKLVKNVSEKREE